MRGQFNSLLDDVTTRGVKLRRSLEGSVNPKEKEHIIPLTESEYAAYVAGVKADQPGLVPGA